MRAIAELRDEPLEEIIGLYTRREGPRRSLKEKANGDCVFFDRAAGCTIYPVRPRQCRTWPFWECNTLSPENWARTATECPGCNHGELIPIEEITRRVRVIRI
jgi:Fe-S-cluster containining protein